MKRDRAAFAAWTVLAAMIAVGLALVAVTAWWWLRPPAWLPAFVMRAASAVQLLREAGAWGALVSIGIMIAHSFIPFPAEILALANGAVFGTLGGSAVTWVGAMLGAASTFWLIRSVGRPAVRRFLAPKDHARLARWSSDRGGRDLLLGRLVPVIAFNLINYAAALSEVSWWTFLWTTGLGILPMTVLTAYLGANMLAMPAWVWALFTTLAVLAWVALHLADVRRRSSTGTPTVK